MPYVPNHHHRRSIRLQDYDYSQEGEYFVTVCTYKRECLFGTISDGTVELNSFGQLVMDHWQNLPKFHSHIEVDAFVVMPNHLHGIIVMRRLSERQLPITAIVGRFKSFSAKAINKQRVTSGYPVWQRNYYEKIIRNEDMYIAIQEYIFLNPGKWDEDSENPATINRAR